MLMKQNEDVRDFDSRLTFVLHIAELVRGEQQVPGLLDAEAIVLEHLARKDDMFCEKLSKDIRLYTLNYPPAAGWRVRHVV